MRGITVKNKTMVCRWELHILCLANSQSNTFLCLQFLFYLCLSASRHEAGGWVRAAPGIWVFCWSGTVLWQSYNSTCAGILQYTCIYVLYSYKETSLLLKCNINTKTSTHEDKTWWMLIHKSIWNCVHNSVIHYLHPLTSLCPLSYTHTSPTLFLSVYMCLSPGSILWYRCIMCAACPVQLALCLSAQSKGADKARWLSAL